MAGLIAIGDPDTLTAHQAADEADSRPPAARPSRRSPRRSHQVVVGFALTALSVAGRAALLAAAALFPAPGSVQPLSCW